MNDIYSSETVLGWHDTVGRMFYGDLEGTSVLNYLP